MLLLLVYLLLNHVLFSCEQARQPISYRSQIPIHKPKPEEEAFLRKLREEIRVAESQRRSMDLDFNFGFGLDEYDVTPLHVFTTTTVRTEQKNNIRAKLKERNRALENNEEFLDYDITPMFWSATPKVNETILISPTELFLPTPVGYGVTTEHVTSSATPNPRQNSQNIPGIEMTLGPGPSGPSNPEHPDQPIEGTTQFPPSKPPDHIPEQSATPFSFPWFSVPQVSTLTPLTLPALQTTYEPGFPSNWTGLLPGLTFPHGVPTLYPKSSMETYIPSTTTARTSSSTELTSPSTVPTLSPSPPVPVPRYQEITAGREAKSKSKNRELWMKLKSERDKSLKSLLRIDVNQNTPIPQHPLITQHILSKVKSWMNKQWTTGSADGRTKTELGVTGPDLRTGPGAVNKASTLRTEITHELMDYENLPVTLPYSPPEEEIVITTPHTPSNVLSYDNTFAATARKLGPNKKYYDMMADLKEGYLMIFLLEFTRLVSEKLDAHVKEVLFPFEFIINGYAQNGSIAWLGESLTAKAKWLGKLFREEGPFMENLIIMKMVHTMLKERKRRIPEDVNQLMDYANSFYNVDEGELLFDALREFEMFPNVPYKGHQLCEKLINAFLNPFRRTHLSTRGKVLKSLTEAALKKRFGRRMFMQELFKLTDLETSRSDNSSNHKQKPSLKKRMEIKRRRKILLRRMFGTGGIFPTQTDQPLEYPRLRSMLPITNNQKRFRVITQRQKTGTDSTNYNMERPTRRDFRRSGRAVHPYNEMMQFFPQIPKEYLKQML